MRSAERVAAIVPAASRERVVPALELPSHLLVSRPASRHKHHVEACQSKDRDRQDRDESHQPHRHDWLSLAKTILAVQYVQQRESEYAQHVDRKGDQEEEEETIVPTTDAVRHPTVKTKII